MGEIKEKGNILDALNALGGNFPEDYCNDTINNKPIHPITKPSKKVDQPSVNSALIQQEVTNNKFISSVNSNAGSCLMVVALLVVTFLLNYLALQIFSCFKSTRYAFSSRTWRIRIFKICLYAIPIIVSCYICELTLQQYIRTDYDSYFKDYDGGAALALPNPIYKFTKNNNKSMTTDLIRENYGNFKNHYVINKCWTVTILNRNTKGQYEKYQVTPFAVVSNNNPLNILALTRKAIVADVHQVTLNSALVKYNRDRTVINQFEKQRSEYHFLYKDTIIKGPEDGMLQCWPFGDGKVFVKYKSLYTGFILRDEAKILKDRLYMYSSATAMCVSIVWILRILFVLLKKAYNIGKNSWDKYTSGQLKLDINTQIRHSRYIKIFIQLINIKFFTVILLLISLLDMPYDFYTIIRFLAMASFGWLCYSAYKVKKEKLMAIYIVLAILYQPLLKISLNREMWMCIDVVVAIFMLILWRIERNQEVNHS